MMSTLLEISYSPVTLAVTILLIPILSIWMALTRFQTHLDWVLAALAVLVYAAFSFFFIYWYVISVYLRWLAPVILLGAVVVSWLRSQSSFTQFLSSPALWTWRVGLVVTILILATLDGMMIKGYFSEITPIALDFPFKNGDYVVAHGGSSFLINYHVAISAENRFAMDIMRLDEWGRRANGILPADLNDYFIYGTPVYSPCSGRVLVVVDQSEDTPVMGNSAGQPVANEVAIDCNGVAVWLEHLQKGTIPVKVGQMVNSGDLLGKAGSSGSSSEPHLHIVAQVYVNGAFGHGIPITFQGQFLVRNSVYHSGN